MIMDLTNREVVPTRQILFGLYIVKSQELRIFIVIISYASD